MGFVSPLPWWLEGLVVVGVALHTAVWLISPRRRPLPEHAVVYRENPTDRQAPAKPFPSLSDPASVYMSVVFPAYKEEKRLPKTLRDTLNHLESRRAMDPSFTYEIIVVDDGSPDSTSGCTVPFIKEMTTDKLRVLRMDHNRGKGGAVTEGVLRARGRYILFADSDGATAVHEIDKLEKHLKQVEKDGLGLAIGSRAHLVNTEVVVKRSLLRNVLMYGFHIVVYLLGVKTVKDTQCGFKMFTRDAARRIFPSMHVEGWIFDIELLILAEMSRIPMAEVGVQWEEVAGSKINLIKDSLIMLKDLFVIRYNYMLGIWRPKHHQD